MQVRTAAAFTLGFAGGMAVLAIGLWSTGHLVGNRQDVAMAATSAGPAISFATAQAIPPTASPATSPSSLASPASPSGGAPPVAFEDPSFDHGARKQPPALPGLLPAPQPAPAPAPGGEADRMTAQPHLAMPLANIDPRKLEDSFKQTRNGHAHEALDLMAPRGTPVLAAAEGNVAKLFTSKQGGLTVYQFDDSQTWCYYYAHLDSYAPGLKEGVLLRKGEVLGQVGSTGDASVEAPHLHFAVFQLGPEKKWWQGTAVNPLPLLK